MARARKLADFRPRTSIRTALSEASEETTLISGWALARLIAWAFYDQHSKKKLPGESNKKDEFGRTKKAPTKRRFSPKYAYKAGQFYLASHLPQISSNNHVASALRELPAEELLLAMGMFLITGQKRMSFGLGGRRLAFLHNDRHKRQELRIVYNIMDFLVRAHLDGRHELCTAAKARKFAEKLEPREERVSQSKIEKIWDLYRTSAPYIYAFCPRLYPAASQQEVASELVIERDDDWVRSVSQLAKRSTLHEWLGHAAFASGILDEGKKARDVRKKDFRGVSAVTPPLRPFDPKEEGIIKDYVKQKQGQ